MLSYSEIIDKQANRLFGRYMSGSNDLRIFGTDIISDIYGVPEAQVTHQIFKQYERVKDAYYKKYDKK